jgi:hypothetical protein
VDYPKIYAALIDRARGRCLSGYVEEHHILPKSMGGSNGAENLVRLTPEEHFLAHLLLVKIHPHRPEPILAVHYMAKLGSYRVNNKLYGWLKKKNTAVQCALNRKTHLGRKNSPETIAKMRLAAKNRKPAKRKPHSPETIAKMREAKLGHKVSVETRAKISANRTGIGLGFKQSAEWIQKRTAGRKPRRTNLQIQQGFTY